MRKKGGREETARAPVRYSGDARSSRAAQERPPQPPDVLVGRVMRDVLGKAAGLDSEGEAGFPRLMVQVWTETLRNRELSVLMREGFVRVRAAWVKIVEAYQEAGLMRDGIPADHVARTMIAVAQGFAAQQALFGEVPVEVLQDGLRALMSMEIASGESWRGQGLVNVPETRPN